MTIGRTLTRVLAYVILACVGFIAVFAVGLPLAKFGFGLITGASGKNKAAAVAESLHKISPPAGYKLSEVMSAGTGDGISAPWGKTFTATKTSTGPVAKECESFIAYANSLGASSLSDESPRYVDSSAVLQAKCVDTITEVGSEIPVSATFDIYGVHEEDGKESRTHVDVNRDCKLPVGALRSCTYQGNVTVVIGDTDFDPNT